MAQSLQARLKDDVKNAMRAREKSRLGVLRLISAAIKQREVDNRIGLDDEGVLEVLVHMVKSRRDSVAHYTKASRNDLIEQETFEIAVIEEYLPQALTSEELQTLIDEAINNSGASSVKDMGKVMGELRPKVRGRTDMGALSALVKTRLG